MAPKFRVPTYHPLIRTVQQLRTSQRRSARTLLQEWGYTEQEARAIVRELIPARPSRRS
jgi:hypothetical protein